MLRHLIPSDSGIRAIKPGNPRKRLSDGDGSPNTGRERRLVFRLRRRLVVSGIPHARRTP